MIADFRNYEISSEEALRLGKLYLKHSIDGTGDGFSLIREIVNLVEKGCFTFSEIGTTSEQLEVMLKEAKGKKHKKLEGALSELREQYIDVLSKLNDISEK